MTCEELLRLLDEDGDVTAPEVSDHLASCPRCAAAVERAMAVRLELAAMASEPSPPFLHARIMANVRAVPRATGDVPSRRWRLVLTPAVALVAFTVLIVGGGSLWLLKEKVSLQDLGAVSPAPRSAEVMAKATLRETAEKAQAPPGDERAKDKGDANAASELADRAIAPVPRKEERSAPSSAPVADEWRQEHQRRSQITGALPAAPAVVAQTEGDDAEADFEAPGSPDLDRVALQEKAVAEQAASEETKRRDDAGAAAQATTQALRASPGRASTSAECTVLSETGGVLRQLALPADLAPNPGQSWLFTVSPTGSVRLDEAEGRAAKPSLAEEVARQLARLELPAGRYRLTRATR